MDKSTIRRQDGFNLVELSIVIVLIGLLVGGVVAAANLLRQSKMGAVIAEMDSITASLNSFAMKYGAQAGDFSQATSYWTAATNGDGDLSIEYGPAGGADAQTLEYRRVWEHLSLAGVMPNPVSIGAWGDAAQVGKNCFRAKIDACYSVLTWGRNPTAELYGAQGTSISLGTPNGRNLAEGGVLEAREARSMDQKLDDGEASTGKFRVRRPIGADGVPLAGCVDADITAATAIYSVRDLEVKCVTEWFF